MLLLILLLLLVLGVGVMGMLGNKGGASVRMTVFDSAMCFVCSHLAAHRENVAGRNGDYKNILEKSVFAAPAPDTIGLGMSGEPNTRNLVRQAVSQTCRQYL